MSYAPTPSIIVFDLDDTLFPENEFVASGFTAVAHWLSDKLKEQSSYYEALLNRIHNEGSRGRVFDECLKRLQVANPLPLVQEMIEVYRYHSPKIGLHKDAESILNEYKNTKTFGLITNGIARCQRQKYSALNLSRYIEHAVFCGDLGQGCQKPSTAPYKHLMSLFTKEIDPSKFLYIGDHAQKDFIGARQLGWQTIRITRADGLHSHVTAPAGIDADHIITSLSELREFI